MRYFLFSLAIYLVGCNQPYGHDYTVIIDTDFTLEEQDAISLACQEWEDVVPELHLHPKLGYCGGEHTGIICTHAWIDPSMAIEYAAYTKLTPSYFFYVDGGDIYFNMKSLEKYHGNRSFYQAMSMTAAHEIGHAMGLSHDNHSPAVMSPQPETSADKPTNMDAQQWHDLR